MNETRRSIRYPFICSRISQIGSSSVLPPMRRRMPQSRPHKRGKNRKQSSRGSFMVTDGRRMEAGAENERTEGRPSAHPRKGAIRELEIVNRPGHERSNDQPTTKEQLAAAMRIHCITTLCTTRITGMACTRPIGHCQGWDRRVIGDRTHSDTKDIGEQVSTACIIQSLAILG